MCCTHFSNTSAQLHTQQNRVYTAFSCKSGTGSDDMFRVTLYTVMLGCTATCHAALPHKPANNAEDLVSLSHSQIKQQTESNGVIQLCINTL